MFVDFSKFRFFRSGGSKRVDFGSFSGRAALKTARFAGFSRFLVRGTFGRASKDAFVDFSKFRFLRSGGSERFDFGSFLGSRGRTDR